MRNGIIILASTIWITPLFAGEIRSSEQPQATESSTGFIGEAHALFRNLGSPYAYGTNGIKPTVDLELLKSHTLSSHRSIASMASTASKLQNTYDELPDLNRKYASAQREAVFELQKGVIGGLISGDDIGAAASTTSDVMRPMQGAVIPMLENQIAGYKTYAHLVAQARELAVELHGNTSATESFVHAWFDKQVGGLGFLDVTNTSGRTLSNCIIIARAVMAEDYVGRTIRAPVGVPFFLGLMGIDSDALVGAAEVENLMVKLHSSEQSAFIYLPSLAPDVRVRFRVCTPSGMHFAMNCYVQVWSDEFTSRELSLQSDLIAVRRRLAQEREKQQIQMQAKFRQQWQRQQNSTHRRRR